MGNTSTSFEKSLQRLEQIVESIEQGKIGLEESIKHFEEGMGLIQRCRKILGEAELKIQRLQAAGDNEAVLAGEAAILNERESPSTETQR